MSETKVETTEATTTVEEAKTEVTPETPATQPAESKETSAPETQEKKEVKTEESPEKKNVVPEKYDLKLPEGTQLKQAHVDKIALIAKEQGLSNEQAQKLLEEQHSVLSTYEAEQKQLQTEMVNTWLTQSMADKEIGGDDYAQKAEIAKRVVTKFSTEGFMDQLDELGLGNHPELLRTFYRIGKAMGEDKMVFSGTQPGAQEKTAAQVLYPNTPTN